MTGVRARESLDARSEIYVASTMPNLLLIEFRFWLSLEALFSRTYCVYTMPLNELDVVCFSLARLKTLFLEYILTVGES